ncbi:MAG: DUF4129 domain-containing protein [Bacteroidota bacterium]
MIVFGAQADAPQKPIVVVTKTSKNIQLKKDSTNLELRKFDEKALQKYRTQNEFIYDDVAPQNVSLWDRFWRWFWDIIRSVFSGGIAGSILNYVLTGIVILLVVFIVIKLTRLDYKLLARKSKEVEVPFQESLENIHEIEFDEQIEKAISSSNYRLAVRLLYLKTLKQLSDRELIVWQAEKTNQAYVLELSNKIQKQDFAALTNQFEYIWYGEFFINKASFEEIDNSFKTFNSNAI